MYWACLGVSFVFSCLSFIGAGFAFIAAATVIVFRQFLEVKIKLWKVTLLAVSPFLGQGLGTMVNAFGYGI